MILVCGIAKIARQQCAQIFVDFMLDYPHEHKAARIRGKGLWSFRLVLGLGVWKCFEATLSQWLFAYLVSVDLLAVLVWPTWV